MDYAEYRRLCLPIRSAPVESTIKQINRRIKSTEKFWLHDGAERRFPYFWHYFRFFLVSKRRLEYL